jgi:hypothetical protein
LLFRGVAALCFLAGCGEPARPLSPGPGTSPAGARPAPALPSASASASEPEPALSASAATSAAAPPIDTAEPIEPAKGAGKEKDAASAVAAVTNLPEVKAFCETLKIKHGLPCLLYVSEVPEETCGPGPAQALDACNFSVYVGENHKTHASRFATFFVRPGVWTVVGADDFACGGMSIADYKKLRAARLKAKPDDVVDCPGD